MNHCLIIVHVYKHMKKITWPCTQKKLNMDMIDTQQQIFRRNNNYRRKNIKKKKKSQFL